MAQEKNEFLDESGLQSVINKFVALFAKITHTHELSEISDYTVDSSLSSTSTNPVQNKVLNAEFDAIGEAMGALEQAFDSKSDLGHTHTYESIEGLEDVIDEIADSKFYVVTFDRGSDNKYHANLTFTEIRAKFEAGGNMVARIDGTEYIPLLSASSNQIIFSGIYKTQSVALTVDSNEVCTLITTHLSDSSHAHPNVSTTVNGFMSKEDKIKLNSIEPSTYETKSDAQVKYDEILANQCVVQMITWEADD